jgi:ArsR family transcriptional regulator
MTQVAKLFRALADSNRLRIVNILSHRDLCVCDLQTVLGLSQPFISRHLAHLRRAGLVHDRREGARVCYSLALGDELGRALSSLLCVAGRNSLTFQSDLQTLSERASNGQLKSAVREIEPGQLTSKAA